MTNRSRTEHHRTASTRSSTERALFNSDEAGGGGGEVKDFLDKIEGNVAHAREKFEQRWNFSVVEEKPVKGRIEWVPVQENKASSSSREKSSNVEKGRLMKGSSSSSVKTIDKHFNLRKRKHNSKTVMDLKVEESSAMQRLTTSTSPERKILLNSVSAASANHAKPSHLPRRHCGCYSLRPLPPRNYSLKS